MKSEPGQFKFKPGQNVWRVSRSERAAMLVDGADYFAAIRSAMLKAQRSIMIAGWDIHSHARLVGPSGEAEDGFPAPFAEFLTALVARRPELQIRILLWDFSVLYAAERDPFPAMTLRWNTPHNIHFALDDCVPIGSSQHQKLVIVDDAVGFSGGLDITIRRWDTSAHTIDDPKRVDPSGKPYPPFHDVQMVVDGEAASALGDLMRERWRGAAYESVPPHTGGGDCWPDGVEPDFIDSNIAISLTQPHYDDQQEVRQVEALFFDMIDAAERTIYIENQFLTALPIAERLAKRLRERPELEALIISPQTHVSWLEVRSMLAGRARFAAVLKEAGERVWLCYPQIEQGETTVRTMIHSKVMIVDDKILRIGSANLNNRSMGTDTECDLTVVAGNDSQRGSIVAMRNRLMADHCGASADEVAVAVAQHKGSLIEAARVLGRNGHCLRDIVDDTNTSPEAFALIAGIADPEKPIGAEEFVSGMLGGFVPTRDLSTVLKVIAAGFVVVVLALIWQFVPLARPDAVREMLADLHGNWLAPFIVVATFIIAGSLMFPVTVLIAATAAAFGPWLGFAYAGVGAMASALVTYGIGAALGKRTLRDLLGPRLNRVRQRVAKRGVIAVAAIRLVPVAPFTVVNLAAGASSIPVFDYMAGTFIGMLPGMIMISAVGNQFARIMTNPTPLDLALLAAAVAGWVALSIGVQVAMSRYWSPGR
ncbi:MAG: VTT domain-containing protein [Pseudolabrys sp.]|nr:VTT domain-containing protein [Pseudolabrys sp.]MDP2294365.1 VTT domain-containing protein [Pseudolabrys sp.]